MTEKVKQLLGERIKEAIKQSEFSQKDIARKLEISENSLSNYIASRRIPDALLITEFANICNLNLNWLLKGQGEMFQNSTRGEYYLEVDAPHGRDALQEEIRNLRRENEALRKKLLELSSQTVRQDGRIANLEEEIHKIKEQIDPVEEDLT